MKLNVAKKSKKDLNNMEENNENIENRKLIETIEYVVLRKLDKKIKISNNGRSFCCNAFLIALFSFGVIGLMNFKALDPEIHGKDMPAPDANYFVPSGCECVHKTKAKTWNSSGGQFDIYFPFSDEKFEVYCDFRPDDGSWTVFQRRQDGSVDFFRNWNDYVTGFGDNDKEFWIGLNNLHKLSNYGEYELRVDMMDWDNNKRFAKYGTFNVGDESTGYKLTVGEYSGNAGDSLADHNNMKFSTKDFDRDSDGTNCASIYNGAWWYNSCHASNLNGLYVKGAAPYGKAINWFHWKGHKYSLKFTELKFRKKYHC
uniref:fibrinogen C domain-containing protein 1-like n=1 Tax=Styela clava TaxID=7725 RepID=UPI00193AC40E|nr:fibrinogen C domain-containing protein 1-like [Styela clava]